MFEKVKKIKGFRTLKQLGKAIIFRDGGNMPYILEICIAGKTKEVSKYHSSRWKIKGEKRNKKKKKTTNTQEKINLRLAAKNLRRKMNHNFEDGDYLVTFDFRKEERPESSKEMTRCMSNFLKRLRNQYKKQGLELKYIYVKELGPRGAAHIHMIMNRATDGIEILRQCWPHGGIHVDPLNSDGQYEKIAEYFVKYADKTIKTEGKQIGKKYYPSQNLKEPVVTKKIIWKSNTFRTTAKTEEGYYLEKESIVEGINKWGYEYFSYTLHQIETIRKERKQE